MAVPSHSLMQGHSGKTGISTFAQVLLALNFCSPGSIGFPQREQTARAVTSTVTSTTGAGGGAGALDSFCGIELARAATTEFASAIPLIASLTNGKLYLMVGQFALGGSGRLVVPGPEQLVQSDLATHDPPLTAAPVTDDQTTPTISVASG